MNVMSLFLVGVFACGESKQPSESTVAPETITQAEQLFEHYEQLRVLFVNDKGEGYAEPINSLVTKCTEYSAIQRCGAITKAAKALQSNGFKDLERSRALFGDLSKAMVGLVSDVPALQSKLSVFSCPMAQDYPNWIQPTSQLENPYMGQRMLKCGKAIEWSDL